MARPRKNVTIRKEQSEWLDDNPGVNLSLITQHGIEKVRSGEWKIVNGEVEEDN